MRNQFDIEVETYEIDSELDGEWEGFDTELADEEWYGEAGGSRPTSGYQAQQSSIFLIRGLSISPPPGLSVTNYLNPSVRRFIGRNRQGRAVNEFIVHETVTRSVADTVNVLVRRRLGVHLIMGSNGAITQHGDL